MKTLVPPPITPGTWLKADGSPFVYALTQNGWNKGQPQMVNRFSASIQRGFESSDAELEANATMMCAANAMAEALARLVLNPPICGMEEVCPVGEFPAKSPVSGCHCANCSTYQACLDALLSAGYTFTESPDLRGAS